MLFAVHDLELHPIDYAEEFPAGVIDFGGELSQVGAMAASGRAELLEEHHGRKGLVKDIRVVGRLETDVQVSCARCLEPVPQHIERSYDLLYRPQGTDAGVPEASIGAAEAEIGYYQGEGLQLEDVLREQVLLALPLRTICGEACRGLCPQCGRNLNVEACQCPEPLADPRWSALQDIRKKLQD